MISKAIKVLKHEAEAINLAAKRIGKDYPKMINLLAASKGKVIVTGMGKPGFIGQKISATLSSTGTPSMFLHPAEALHGDLGRVTKNDIVIAISKSGETEEIVKLLPLLKHLGTKIISIVGNTQSTLARFSDYILDATVTKEVCSLNLAPTTSTTVMLALGDAIAISLIDKKKFKEKDFAFYHPAGSLGKKLYLKVSDIMRTKKMSPVVKENAIVSDVLVSITKSRAGSATVVNSKGKVSGIFTDGDLRRHLKKDSQITKRKIKEVMTKNPAVINQDKMALDAYQILEAKNIDEIPVVDNLGRPVGLLDIQDLLTAGIV